MIVSRLNSKFQYGDFEKLVFRNLLLKQVLMELISGSKMYIPHTKRTSRTPHVVVYYGGPRRRPMY
mgnify:CR=1 FL=1